MTIHLIKLLKNYSKIVDKTIAFKETNHESHEFIRLL